VCTAVRQKPIATLLGGTELRDIHGLCFIDPKLATISSEVDRKGCELAQVEADQLAALGATVDLQLGDFFSYKRQSDLPHTFSFSTARICASGDYDARFSEMFRDEVINQQAVAFAVHLFCSEWLSARHCS
jgi:hypothetical protein